MKYLFMWIMLIMVILNCKPEQKPESGSKKQENVTMPVEQSPNDNKTAQPEAGFNLEAAIELLLTAGKQQQADVSKAAQYYTKESDELERMAKGLELMKKMGMLEQEPELRDLKPQDHHFILKEDKAIMCEKGSLSVQYFFKRVNGKWLIHGVKFDKDFQALLRKCRDLG